jgi:serine protease Do
MDNQQKQFFSLTIVASLLISSIAGFLAGNFRANLLPKLNANTAGKNIQTINGASQNSNNTTTQTAQEDQVVQVVKSASPAVVSIIISKDLSLIQQQNPYWDFFGGQWPFGDLFGQTPQSTSQPSNGSGTQKQEIGGGTGFIVSSDGLILTNKHVVEDTQADYTVLTNDGQKYTAKVLARDPVQDLAIIKIEKTNLPTLKFGDSDKIEIGQSVIAIGNALGEFRNTVSLGVISGLQRSIAASSDFGQSAEQLENVIQTDAAINPGNSGGPLIDLAGDVVGINVAVAQGAQSIGFALPANIAKRDIDQVKKTGKISVPYIGVRYVLITPELKQQNNLTVDYGALILRGQSSGELAIVPGSPADRAGLVENDIILEADGKKITTENTLSQIIQEHNVGDAMTLKILHAGQEKTIRVVLGER